jgi:putative lipoprotein
MRKRHTFRALSAALVALSAASLAGCVHVPADGAMPAVVASELVITGSVTYHEPIKPPEGSALNVVLSDTSRADAPSIELADWSISMDEGGVPVKFTLSPPDGLAPKRTYTVRAFITGPDGALLWTTFMGHRVSLPLSYNVNMGELVMEKVEPNARPTSALVGAEWIVDTIGGKAVSSKEPPTITFGETGTLSGFGGCNRFSGGYTQNGAKVTFQPVMMTLMACPQGNVNVLESTLGSALNGDATYVIDGDGMLTLTGANGVVITAKKAAPVQSLALSDWHVTKMGSVAIVSGKEPTIRFTKDGRIEGTTGCNRFFGSYVQDGAKVTFSGTGATKMACLQDGVMQQELAFLAILQGEAELSFERRAQVLSPLTLTGANGISFTGIPILYVPSKPAPKPDSAALKGGVWIVEDINRTGIIDNSRLTLTFGADGRVSGSTNCNGFSGTYTVDGAKLTLGALMMTRRACLAEALSRQEQKYTDALDGELSWTITDDGALELTGAEGRRVLLRR